MDILFLVTFVAFTDVMPQEEGRPFPEDVGFEVFTAVPMKHSSAAI
jgi:hypothetical protein